MASISTPCLAWTPDPHARVQDGSPSDDNFRHPASMQLDYRRTPPRPAARCCDALLTSPPDSRSICCRMPKPLLKAGGYSGTSLFSLTSRDHNDRLLELGGGYVNVNGLDGQDELNSASTGSPSANIVIAVVSPDLPWEFRVDLLQGVFARTRLSSERAPASLFEAADINSHENIYGSPCE